MMDAYEVILKRFALSSEIDISYLSYPQALLSYIPSLSNKTPYRIQRIGTRETKLGKWSVFN